MSKRLSLISAFVCCLIWGTTFIAQDTGMDEIGPFTFNGVGFFVGFLALVPFFLIIEKNKFFNEFNKDRRNFLYLSISIGIFLFLASALQQVALLYTDVANAAFFTIFYVPLVPFVLYILYRKKVHWSVWPSVLLCVRKGDILVLICALFWSLHIIFIGQLVEKFDLPVTVGLIQTLIVSILSIFIGLVYETFTISNILSETYEILYAGVLSGGFAFVLQIYAQKNISPAPAAIIYSLEGVFATIAAWIILNQILNIDNILGCLFILAGVLLSQLMPEFKRLSIDKPK